MWNQLKNDNWTLFCSADIRGYTNAYHNEHSQKYMNPWYETKEHWLGQGKCKVLKTKKSTKWKQLLDFLKPYVGLSWILQLLQLWRKKTTEQKFAYWKPWVLRMSGTTIASTSANSKFSASLSKLLVWVLKRTARMTVCSYHVTLEWIIRALEHFRVNPRSIVA